MSDPNRTQKMMGFKILIDQLATEKAATPSVPKRMTF
jgi:hypothetical protein